MGWFSKLLGSTAAPEEKAKPQPNKAPVFLRGDGNFSQDVVGE